MKIDEETPICVVCGQVIDDMINAVDVVDDDLDSNYYHGECFDKG